MQATKTDLPPPVGIGLYGINGHQVIREAARSPRARLVAVAAVPRDVLPEPLRDDPELRQGTTLDELLDDPRVELIALCSPRRADQARDAIRCLAAGRHVYAEKPCALREADLDAILDAASRYGRCFREMAGTAFEAPFRAMRETVARGEIGELVQALAQKSYPYHDQRPQDEDVDGGLLLQVGVHALRMIEHVGGVRARDIRAMETSVGNPHPGDLRMAVSFIMRLENGGVASAVVNYLNPRPFGRWGNESLRLFGTRGMLEAVDGGARTRLVTGERDLGPLPPRPTLDYFEALLTELRGGERLPLDLDTELHPTRMVLRARERGLL